MDRVVGSGDGLGVGLSGGLGGWVLGGVVFFFRFLPGAAFLLLLWVVVLPPLRPLSCFPGNQHHPKEEEGKQHLFVCDIIHSSYFCSTLVFSIAH